MLISPFWDKVKKKEEITSFYEKGWLNMADAIFSINLIQLIEINRKECSKTQY